MFSTVRDEFPSASFSLNNGTQAWASNWIESDTKGIGTGTGNIGAPASSNCASGAGNCLYVYNLNPGDNIYREVNLSGATSASLTLWRNNLLSGLNNNDSVVLEASTNGANWTVLRTWRDVTQDVGTAYEQFDLTPYTAELI